MPAVAIPLACLTVLATLGGGKLALRLSHSLPTVIAWGIYGAASGVRSSLLNTPLGCFDVSVTTSACWAQFKAQGVAVIGWARVSAFFPWPAKSAV